MAEGQTDLDSNVEPDECPSNFDVCRPFQTSLHYSKFGVAVSDECGKLLNDQATLAEIRSCKDKEPHQRNQHSKCVDVRDAQGEHLNEPLDLTEPERLQIREPYQQIQNSNGVAVRDERWEHLNEQLSLAEIESCQDKEQHDQKENDKERVEIAQRLSDFCLHDRGIEHGTESLNAERTVVVEEHYVEDFTHTCIDAEGDTPLHLAILCLYTIENILCIINTILNTFPDHDVLNYQNYQYRQTPLHLAVLTGRTDIVRSLVEMGAQTTLQDNQLRTPAHIACGKDGVEILKALLKSEENGPTRSLSLYDNQGQTCLHIAAMNCNIELVKVLLDHGADINAPDRKSGRTAVHFAVEVGYINLITCLLRYRELKVHVWNFASESPVQLAYGRRATRADVVEHLQRCRIISSGSSDDNDEGEDGDGNKVNE